MAINLLPAKGSSKWKSTVNSVAELPNGEPAGSFRYVLSPAGLYVSNGTVYSPFSGGGGGGSTNLGNVPSSSDVTITSSTGTPTTIASANGVSAGVMSSAQASKLASLTTPFVFTQAVAAATWIVNHNLGFKPNVSLFTVGGLEFEAEVVHVSVNQFQVNLTSAAAGSATAN
jgi:hypothetical protein